MELSKNVEVVYKSGRKHTYPNVSDFFYYFDENTHEGLFVLSSIEFRTHQHAIPACIIKTIGYLPL